MLRESPAAGPTPSKCQKKSPAAGLFHPKSQRGALPAGLFPSKSQRGALLQGYFVQDLREEPCCRAILFKMPKKSPPEGPFHPKPQSPQQGQSPPCSSAAPVGADLCRRCSEGSLCPSWCKFCPGKPQFSSTQGCCSTQGCWILRLAGRGASPRAHLAVRPDGRGLPFGVLCLLEEKRERAVSDLALREQRNRSPQHHGGRVAASV